MTKFEATSKIQRLRQTDITDDELAKKIGISKPTLYARITNHNWKVAELFLIENLKFNNT